MVEIETTSLLLCRLADEPHALLMSDVREVIRWRVPTPIPGSPETILGVIHHRGVVLPVVDLRPLLGLDTPPPKRSTRLLIVEHGGLEAALVSDAVVDIVEIEQSAVEPVPASLAAAQARFLAGLVYWAEQPVALLTLATLFAALTVDHAAG
ncbi:MAG: chemotaxis protein CheW [Chloroflexi bacterium]|nr:MAG: chemotaxis protein CheW [Chloroflexota bacterium]